MTLIPVREKFVISRLTLDRTCIENLAIVTSPIPDIYQGQKMFMPPKTRPFKWWFVIRRLGLAMNNMYATFKVF